MNKKLARIFIYSIDFKGRFDKTLVKDGFIGSIEIWKFNLEIQMNMDQFQMTWDKMHVNCCIKCIFCILDLSLRMNAYYKTCENRFNVR